MLLGLWLALLESSKAAVAYHYDAPWRREAAPGDEDRHDRDQIPMQRYLISM